MERSSRSFTVVGNKSLEQAGLSGHAVKARLDGGTLTLAGGSKGELVIPAGNVDRLRHFRMAKVQDPTYTLPTMYETKIWWGGRSKPILLMPSQDQTAFLNGIGDLAAAVEAAHGPGRRYIGPGATTAIINFLIVGIPVLLLLAFVWGIAAVDGGWWWAGAIGITLLFGWLGGRSILSRWPRRVSLERLQAELH